MRTPPTSGPDCSNLPTNRSANPCATGWSFAEDCLCMFRNRGSGLHSLLPSGRSHPTQACLPSLLGKMKASSRAQRQVDNAAKPLATATQKQALARILKALKANPERILPLLPLAEGDSMFKKMKADAGLGCWPQQYNKFAQAPKDFMKAVLCEVTPSLDPHVMDKAHKADGNALPQIIVHCFGLDMGWSLPKGALNKAVLKQAVKTRYALLGKHLSQLYTMLGENSKLNFKDQVAGYKLLSENIDKCPSHVFTEVEHISGAKALVISGFALDLFHATRHASTCKEILSP